MSSQPCILVLSNSEIPAGILREMLPRDSFPSVLFAASITAARRTLLAREVDLLVIDAPLQKESALGFAQEIAQRSTPGLLLLMYMQDRQIRSGYRTAAVPQTGK